MPSSRYMTLLQVTVGQEDVEEIIRRCAAIDGRTSCQWN